MPNCHRRPTDPQNSPSHIHMWYPGNLGTVEPSGSVIAGPLASLSTCSETNRSGFSSIRASSSNAACGRRLSGDQPC